MIKGIIFDMDGVISDTQKLHSRVESALLGRFGIYITPSEVTRIYSGIRTKDFFKDLLMKQKKHYDLDALMQEKWKMMQDLAAKSVEEIPGAVELIKRLRAKGFPLAVASASNSDYVFEVLKKIGVTDCFDAIVTGEMVRKGKPDPEIFILAANKIDVDPKDCLVIEDSTNGMIAAITANMKCIGLVTSREGKYPTNNLVESLSEVDDEYLENI